MMSWEWQEWDWPALFITLVFIKLWIVLQEEEKCDNKLSECDFYYYYDFYIITGLNLFTQKYNVQAS